MLNAILKDKEFSEVLTEATKGVLLVLFEKEVEFSILVKLDGVTFEPELPKEISSAFGDLTLFTLAGYTFESADIYGDELKFEAGFGKENIGAIVTVKISRIVQILIGEDVIHLNLSATQEVEEEKSSFDIFSTNPNNSKFFK